MSGILFATSRRRVVRRSTERGVNVVELVIGAGLLALIVLVVLGVLS